MNMLYLKHRLVVSPAGSMLLAFRHSLSRLNYLKHPELALLREEEVMMRSGLAEQLNSNAICVDVGAHIGSVTQLFRTVAPEGRHILIEASPSKAAWLRAAFPDYPVHQKAVSDTEGKVSFYENLDRPGYSSLGSRGSRGRLSEIVTDCTTLDRLLADEDRIDLIKIDVEGFEYNVVKGALDTFSRCRPMVIFEAGAAADKEIDNESYLNLFRLFSDQLDYDIRPIFGWKFKKPPISEQEFMACRIYPFLAFNFVALPRERA